MKRSKQTNTKWKCGAWLLGGLFALVGLTHCAPMNDDMGAASLSVTKKALTGADIVKMTVTVTGTGIATPIQHDLVKSQETWKGTIQDIPKGKDRTFVAEAFDNKGAQLYKGEASAVEIIGGKTALVMIVLQQSTPPQPFYNTAPDIDSLVANPGVVQPGGMVDLSVTAHDVDTNDTLSYDWTANGGIFSQSTSPQTIWNAPAQLGSYRITLTVSDKKGLSVVASVTIQVESPSDGIANIEASFNNWPQVSNLIASPSRIDKGESTSLVLLSSDMDGDNLKYEWTDEGGECMGTFSNTTEKSPIWTAPFQRPAKGKCLLTVKITDDNGGVNHGRVLLQVGEPLLFQKGQTDIIPPVTMSNKKDMDLVSGPGEVTLTCVDSSSGCQAIVYTVDGSTPSFDPPHGTIVLGSEATPEVFQLLPVAIVTLKFASRDKAGNIEAVQSIRFNTVF